MIRNSKTVGKLLTLTLLTSVACFADVVSDPPMSGTFFVSGIATVGLTSISFSPSMVTVSDGCTTSACTPTGNLPDVGDAVSIATINEMITPVGEAFPPLANWLTVDGDSLTLTTLPVGVNTPAPVGTPPCQLSGGVSGDTCTPEIPVLVSPGNPLGLSNFNLQNLNTSPSSFIASFGVSGTAVGPAPAPDESTFIGSFTATLPGTYQNELGLIETSGPQMLPFTAQFTFTPVPEPSFLPILGGIGIAGIVLGLFRKTRTV
jgi:hypothetical protein